jgi:hypothetical protein
MIMTNDSRF